VALDREVRVSPDGLSVAIRGDNPADAFNAWMVGHAIHGGHWASTEELASWSVVTAVEPPADSPA